MNMKRWREIQDADLQNLLEHMVRLATNATVAEFINALKEYLEFERYERISAAISDKTEYETVKSVDDALNEIGNLLTKLEE